MSGIVVVTTSYPRQPGDAEGHFVAAEVRRLSQTAEVTVLAPGVGRTGLFGERVIGLPGDDAFGFPGALARLRADPRRALSAGRFAWSAQRWLERAPSYERVIAHFLLPCGVPIATRALRGHPAELEVVVHGSDARLFARMPVGRELVARELVRAQATLRFVSQELQALVLGKLPEVARHELAARSRVEPSPIDVEATPAKLEARRLLDIRADAKLAVVVARLVSGKRVAVALEACRRIRGLQALVVGDGPELAALRQQFPAVRFVGHVTRPTALAYIAAADVLVSASQQEGSPTVIREARALGTPVVCLEAGDLRAWAASDSGLSVVA